MGCIQQKRKSIKSTIMLTANELTDGDATPRTPQYSINSKTQKNEVSQQSVQQQMNLRAADYLIKLRQGNQYLQTQQSPRMNQSRSLSPRNGNRNQKPKKTLLMHRNALEEFYKPYEAISRKNFKPSRPSGFSLMI